MELERAVGICSILAGGGLLYVGWANIGGLMTPFALCAYLGDPSVYLGPNYAVVYNGGCTPYEYAYVVFAFVSIAGLTLLASGLYSERQYREIRTPT